MDVKVYIARALTTSAQEKLFDEVSYYLNRVFSAHACLGDTDSTCEDIDTDALLDKDANALAFVLDSEAKHPSLSGKRYDSYVISLDKGHITIVSNSHVGLFIGFYQLMEYFGVRFIAPGRAHEYIPETPMRPWDVQDTIAKEPSFDHRGSCIEGADSFEVLSDFISWLPKIGMNSFFIQFENPYAFFKRWYTHEFNPYSEEEDFSNELVEEYSARTDALMSALGLHHHRVGHGWTGEVLGYSSKYGWEKGLTLPPEKEPLVALRNGKRELFDGAPILTSLDFANPEVSEKMIASIVAYAKARKDVDYLHVWLSDAFNNICECDACARTLVSDQYVDMLNHLDERLAQEGLDTKICFLLYQELLFAPKTKKINHPERFVMMFAPISRTFEKSYADVNYDHLPEPKEYVRNHITLPNSLEENLSYLFSWKKAFEGDSFVYDYPLGRAHYGDMGYMAISKVISRDIHYLHELGLNGYIACQELRSGFPTFLPNYTMGKMLYDERLSFDEIKDEYMRAAYGTGADQACAYLESLSEYSSCDYFNAIGARINPELANKYETAWNIADEFLSSIQAMCIREKGIAKENWKRLSLHRRYVMLITRALELQCRGRKEAAQRVYYDFLDFIRTHEAELLTFLDVYRVIEVSSRYTGFSRE